MSDFLSEVTTDESSLFARVAAQGPAAAWPAPAAAGPSAAAAPAAVAPARTVTAQRGFMANALEGIEHVIDTVQAAGELKSKFDIVAPDAAPTRPNQVTQAQYERLCETYSDIRRGKTNLQFETSGMNDVDAARSKQATMGHLATIMQTGAGRELLTHMAYSHDTSGAGRTVRILADRGAASANTFDDSRLLDDPRRYDGGGLGSKVVYNPERNPSAPDPADKEPWLRSMRPDVALFHELLHAQHLQDGDVAKGLATSGLDVVHTRAGDLGAAKAAEEQVVGIGGFEKSRWTENGYRAERRRLGEDAVPRDSYTTASERAKLVRHLETP